MDLRLGSSSRVYCRHGSLPKHSGIVQHLCLLRLRHPQRRIIPINTVIPARIVQEILLITRNREPILRRLPHVAQEILPSSGTHVCFSVCLPPFSAYTPDRVEDVCMTASRVHAPRTPTRPRHSSHRKCLTLMKPYDDILRGLVLSNSKA